MFELNKELDKLNLDKQDVELSLKEENIKNKNLTLNITDLENKIIKLVDQLGLEKLNTTKQKTINSDLNLTIKDLNKNIILLNNELQAVQRSLEQTDKDNKEKDLEISNLGIKLNEALKEKVGELEGYRSEFFGKLKKK